MCYVCQSVKTINNILLIKVMLLYLKGQGRVHQMAVLFIQEIW